MTAPLVITGRRPFAELFAEPKALKAAIDSIHRTISDSFAPGHPGHMVNLTQAEVRRRFTVCEDWYRTLRADMHWSSDRALSALPRALLGELTGEKYEPEGRSTYIDAASGRRRVRPGRIILPGG